MTDARHWLGRARSIDKEIKSLEKAIQEARDQAVRITQRYSSDGAQSTKDPHKLDRLVILEDQIQQKKDELLQAKTEILEAIYTLQDGRQRTVLNNYYINLMTIEEIAVGMHYSYRQTKRYHRTGIAEIEKMAHNVP